MTLEERCKKYKLSPEILKDYKDSPKFIEFNKEDPDLDTITVDLPPTPDWNLIDGFGLKAKDQFFKRVEMPEKLVDIQEKTDIKGKFLNQDEIWEILDEEREYYADEIEFIRMCWRKRLYGHWFFNNGVATYLDGWNWLYLNFYELDIGLPEYRDRDRRFFIFARFIYDDEDFYGFIYPKHRREGATYKTSCIHYEIITRLIKARGGIQSMTDESGADVYQKHIVDPWKSMPFFFKPNHNGGDDPQKILRFRASSSRGEQGNKGRSRKELLSEISYRASGEKAYDGTKLYFYHHEEIGKSRLVDINRRWEVVQLCLSTGAGKNIHGFSIHTSTVGEMEKGGGERMLEFCEGSKYNNRNENNQTDTGLCILFMPAYDGLEGFIDAYGMSVIDTPTPQQEAFLEAKRNDRRKKKSDKKDITVNAKNIGARRFIENTIEYYKKNINKRGMKDKLAQFQREHPTTFNGCFRMSNTGSFLDTTIIQDRLEQLREQHNRDLVTRGRFEWMGKPFRSKVKFIVDPEGRFEISKLMGELANRCMWDDYAQTWRAENKFFCAGADPFKNDETSSKKKSMFGGAVFWGHDPRVDNFGKPIHEWESCRFVCTYNCRPDTVEEACEEMAMMCMYFGCPMFPEVDVEAVRKFFKNHNFGGMLVHEIKNDDFVAQGGVTAARFKQPIFHSYRDQIFLHGMRERHKELLEQCRDIRGKDEFTDYDLFAAGGYAMEGLKMYHPYLVQEIEAENETSDLVFFEERSYNL